MNPWVVAIAFALVAIAGGFLFMLIWQLQQQVRKSEHDLTESRGQFQTLVSNLPGVVYRCANDAECTMRYISKGIETVTGYPPEDFIHNRVRSYASMIYEDDREKAATIVQEALKSKMPFTREYRLVHRNGTLNWVHERGTGIYDEEGNLLYIDGIILDINERKRLEEELRIFATTDPVTGVFNRHFGLSYLQKQLNLLKRVDSVLSVIYVDINNLKMVNDQFGHQEGDKLINDVTKILRESLRKSDVICRVGGDEFLLILSNTDAAGAEKLWKRVIQRMETENHVAQRKYWISVSYGIVEVASDSELTLESVLSLADERMYENKRIQKRLDGIA